MNLSVISSGVLKWSDPFDKGNQFSTRVVTSRIKLAAIILGQKSSQPCVDQAYLEDVSFFCQNNSNDPDSKILSNFLGARSPIIHPFFHL